MRKASKHSTKPLNEPHITFEPDTRRPYKRHNLHENPHHAYTHTNLNVCCRAHHIYCMHAHTVYIMREEQIYDMKCKINAQTATKSQSECVPLKIQTINTTDFCVQLVIHTASGTPRARAYIVIKLHPYICRAKCANVGVGREKN